LLGPATPCNREARCRRRMSWPASEEEENGGKCQCNGSETPAEPVHWNLWCGGFIAKRSNRYRHQC
jgi:hypothetical protein